MLLLLLSGTGSSGVAPPSLPTPDTVLTNTPSGAFYSKENWAALLAQIEHERDLEQIDRDAERKAEKLAAAKASRARFLARWRR